MDFESITYTQLSHALGLAKAFSHSWGQFRNQLLSEFKGTRVIALDEVNNAIIAARNGDLPNNMTETLFPMVNEEGAIVHQSKTGRVKWTIRRDGSVDLEIQRSTGPVLQAHCTMKGDACILQTITILGMAAARHYEALGKALLAILPEDPIGQVYEIDKGFAKTLAGQYRHLINTCIAKETDEHRRHAMHRKLRVLRARTEELFPTKLPSVRKSA